MKILCVAMNYASHCHEMGGEEKPAEPVVFLKPDSALLRNRHPFFLPEFSDDVQYEAELVVRIGRLGKNIAPQYAHRYYDAVTLGIDFTARDMQRRARSCGNPWMLSKGFDGSAAVGDWITIDDLPRSVQELGFELQIDGRPVQQGRAEEMIFKVDELVAYASSFMTLKMGDILFTGTPAGVGPVKVGNHLEGFLEDRKVLDINIR